MSNLQTIHGTAAKGSSITVVGVGGETIGKATADDAGEWSLDPVDVEPGSQVRADIAEPSGRRHSTEWLTIEAEEPAATPEPQVDAAIRDRLRSRYAIILGDLVDGSDVSYPYLIDLAGALGKSAVDVHADIEALDREKRLTRLEAMVTERTSQR